MVKDSDGKVVGCHTSKDKAKKQLAALYANEEKSMVMEPITRPPRENLVRAIARDLELREVEGAVLPTLRGHFAVFNDWTEIDSAYEGHFMERISPGAASQTIAENRKSMKVLYNHGHDPSIGDKVLGPIEELGEDETGVFYEVPLLDTSYNRDLLPGLKAGLYGASFRFAVTGEQFDRDAQPSDHNPDGLPERTITKMRIYEFGPVTFPAYEGATASARSLTDEFVFHRLAENRENLRKLVTFENALEESVQTSVSDGTAETAPTPPGNTEPKRTTEPKEAKVDELTAVDIDHLRTVPDLLSRQSELEERNTSIWTEAAGQMLAPDKQAEFDRNEVELEKVTTKIKYIEEHEARVAKYGQNQGATERIADTFQVKKTTEDPFDMVAVRRNSSSPEEEQRKLRDNAKGVVERASFPHPSLKREDAQEHVFKLLGSRDQNAALSRLILATGSELYDRAFGKYLSREPRTPREDAALHAGTERALSLTGASGGFAIPFELDPTILGTSNGAVNPWRQLARVEQITVDEWRGVSSAGVTVAYAAEAAETTDNAPTLVQPTVSTEKAQAFIPFSIEVGMDWDGLRGEMSRLLSEGKDELEAVKFATGNGTNEPFGVITGATNTVTAGAAGTFTIANLYALMAALPPRYRPRASFAGNLAIQQKIRQFETTGGSAAGVYVEGLQNGMPDRLLGRPFFEASAMSAVTTVGALFLIYGDFSRFLIVDRIGLTVELIDHLVGTNHRPTGQRGLYAYFRNGSKVLDANAFRVLIGSA